MCTKLLSRGGLPTLEYCNRDGRTPLTLSIIHEKQQSVNWLLIKGADPHVEDLGGYDSCDYAMKSSLFMHQPAFNSCREGLRKRPILGIRPEMMHTCESYKAPSETRSKLALLEGKS